VAIEVVTTSKRGYIGRFHKRGRPYPTTASSHPWTMAPDDSSKEWVYFLDVINFAIVVFLQFLNVSYLCSCCMHGGMVSLAS
jgi:hypothetical protein